jgi:hypothetical protein
MEEYDALIDKYLNSYNIYPYKEKGKDYQGFSNFLKTLLDIDLSIDEFEKMSEGDKIEYRRNFKIEKLLNK